jgi:hypothetical protein
MLIYLKGLQEEIDILSPSELGGMKSSEFCALNPQVCQTFRARKHRRGTLAACHI